MKGRLKHFLFSCGIALTLAAFPVFGQTDAKINRQPLRDFSQLVIDRLQKNEVVLSDNFLVEISGELGENGKFDRKKTRYVRAEGSQRTVDIAKSGIEAINETGLFKHLSQLGSDKLNVIFAQTDEQLYAVINFEFDSANKIKTAKSGFEMVLSISKASSKNEDEKILLDGASISESGKTVTIKIAVEKTVAQEMIRRKLSEEINRKLKSEAGK